MTAQEQIKKLLEARESYSNMTHAEKIQYHGGTVRKINGTACLVSDDGTEAAPISSILTTDDIQGFRAGMQSGDMFEGRSTPVWYYKPEGAFALPTEGE